MPAKKPTKKTIKKGKSKTWEEIEREKEALENKDNWLWDECDDKEMQVYLRRFCCHMVWTGLDAITNGLSQESREDILTEIMETKRWQLSEEEMLLYIPDVMLLEELQKYAPLTEDGTREMNEVQFMLLCNRLAEIAVFNMMNELEKKGFLTLAWDSDKNDFVYKPGPNSVEDEGEGWKNV